MLKLIPLIRKKPNGSMPRRQSYRIAIVQDGLYESRSGLGVKSGQEKWGMKSGASDLAPRDNWRRGTPDGFARFRRISTSRALVESRFGGTMFNIRVATKGVLISLCLSGSP